MRPIRPGKPFFHKTVISKAWNMRIALLIASSLLVTACDGRETADTIPPADTRAPRMGQMGDHAMAADMPNTAEDDVQRAAISDMYEIQAGQLAVEKASADEVRTFGQMMIDNHTAATSDMMAAVEQSDGQISMPQQLNSEHQAMIGSNAVRPPLAALRTTPWAIEAAKTRRPWPNRT